LVTIYIIVDVLASEASPRKKNRTALAYTCAVIAGLIAPSLFVDTSQFSLKLSAVGRVLQGFNGHLFQDVLFNFDVLWILFLAGIPLCKRSEQLNILLLFLLTAAASLIGSTDWFRTFFAASFFVVLPLAARTIDFVTSSVHMKFVRVPVIVFFSILLIKPKPFLDFDYVRNPNMQLYTYAAAFLVICYLANLWLRQTPVTSYEPEGKPGQ
jgi:hypothetical protein